MGIADVLSQSEAWKAYDQWLADDRVSFLAEPSNLEVMFRNLSRQSHPTPKDWADAYLAAFALGAELELVSFDQGFRGKVKNLQLLSM
jgi:predicted nucleic acid-binding protein